MLTCTSHHRQIKLRQGPRNLYARLPPTLKVVATAAVATTPRNPVPEGGSGSEGDAVAQTARAMSAMVEENIPAGDAVNQGSVTPLDALISALFCQRGRLYGLLYATGTPWSKDNVSGAGTASDKGTARATKAKKKVNTAARTHAVHDVTLTPEPWLTASPTQGSNGKKGADT